MVINSVCGAAKDKTAPATSSGVPRRCKGVIRLKPSRRAGSSCDHISLASVWIKPGAGEPHPFSRILFTTALEKLQQKFKQRPAALTVSQPPAEDLTGFSKGIQANPQGDTAANIEHLKALGFEWVKLDMAWKTVEPAQGTYDWGHWDQVINAYAANGIKVMLAVAAAPDWARPVDDDKMSEGPPADPATYAAFVAQVAGRYQDKVQAIEIWGRQNVWLSSGGENRIDAAKYVELLQHTYQAIKTANPDLVVISGGLSPVGPLAEEVNPSIVDDVLYLRQMYTHGAKDYFDLLGARHYGLNCPALADWRTVEDETAVFFREPFENRHRSWCFLGPLEAYREVMRANGDEQKHVAITSFGWSASTRIENPSSLDNTPQEQARWIIEAYQWAEQQPWIGPMVLYNLDYDSTWPEDRRNYFSILGRPVYEALLDLNKGRPQLEPIPMMALKDIRQLTPCENNGRHHIFIKVQDAQGEGLNDIPVKIQWGPNPGEYFITTTRTWGGVPGRIQFQMAQDKMYSVRVQNGRDEAQVTSANVAEEPCPNGRQQGNAPGQASFEVVFERDR